MHTRELVIVGGGPAGMAVAIAAHKNGIRDILLLERDQFLGGILNQCIHTGFGVNYFGKVLSGPEYAERFVNQINKIDEIEVSLQSFVTNLTADKIITYLKPGQLIELKAKAIVMTTGCRERTREMIHIAGTRPSGIYPAGLAQKLINMEGLLPGHEIVIVGSGDIGLIMARRFTFEGAKVKGVVEIQKQSKGLQRNIVQCLEDFDIPLYLNHKVERIYGENRVESIDIVKVDDKFESIPESIFNLTCDTLLVSAGLIPENELIEMAGVKLDKKTNTPITTKLGVTSIDGLFVAGNSLKIYDLVDSVTEESVMIGETATKYLGNYK